MESNHASVKAILGTELSTEGSVIAVHGICVQGWMRGRIFPMWFGVLEDGMGTYNQRRRYGRV